MEEKHLGIKVLAVSDIPNAYITIKSDQKMIKEAAVEKRLLEKWQEHDKTLEYWMEYLVRFGVWHKIPAYDKMSIVAFHNYDIMACGVLLILVMKFLCKKICCKCCCRCCPCCKCRKANKIKEKNE